MLLTTLKWKLGGVGILRNLGFFKLELEM